MKETKLSLLSYACWGIIKGINLEGTIGKEQLDIQKALRHCCTAVHAEVGEGTW